MRFVWGRRPDVTSGRLTCEVWYFHTKYLLSKVQLNRMILYLFIKDRVKPCFAYSCNSYNLKRMIIHVIRNEISIWFFLSIINALKDLPRWPLPVQGTQEMALQKVQFQNFSRGHPPRTPLVVRAFGTNARTYGAHVRLFHLWIWYFKCYRKPTSRKRDQLCFFTMQRIDSLIVGSKTGIACS